MGIGELEYTYSRVKSSGLSETIPSLHTPRVVIQLSAHSLLKVSAKTIPM
jgi:hypothetical protein